MCKNLIRIFLLSEHAKKKSPVAGAIAPRTIQRAAGADQGENKITASDIVRQIAEESVAERKSRCLG